MRTLKINTTWASLEGTSTRAVMQIRNKMRRSKVTTTPPKMTVEREKPQMNVNWDKVWSESGKKKPAQLMQHTTVQNQQAAVEATINHAADGNYVGGVNKYHGKEGSPFADLAVQEMKANIPELGMGTIPKSMPEVDWNQGSMSIEWEMGDVKIEWDKDFMPEFTVTPHSVEIRLNGKPQVQISMLESNAPRFEGRKINERI